MKKTLGFRLMDSIKEVMELENAKTELMSALYLKKIDEKVNIGIELIENSLKGQAKVYGVNYENYKDRVKGIIANYTKEIEKVREEYEFQFVNLQLELREILANQKIAIVNAKKISDTKIEFMKSDKYNEYLNTKRKLVYNLNNALKKIEYDKYYSMIKNLPDPLEIYNQKKASALNKYSAYNSLVKSCEAKINYCMNETFLEVERITKENIENSLIILKESVISKILNKIISVFSGRTKFENKLKLLENNVDNLSLKSDKKIDQIRKITIELVAEIQAEKDSLIKIAV